jgi:hypothetical protein
VTQEEKVRNAVRVADELIDRNHRPSDCFYPMWRDIFNALLHEEYFYRNMTATGAQIFNENQGANTTTS